MLASAATNATERRAALEELCETYWYPLYAYARRTASSRDDAADIVQQFFATLLARGDFERADPKRGRFRSWLLTALRNFVANQRERRRALERGGALRLLSFDADEADTRFAREPADPRSLEQHFEWSWAKSVLERAHRPLGTRQARGLRPGQARWGRPRPATHAHRSGEMGAPHYKAPEQLERPTEV